MPRRLYWEASVFLGLLNPDEAKHSDCRAVWEEARRGHGDTIIFTSFWSFAEVFKVRSEGPAKPLDEAQDRQIEAMFRQPWIQPVVVDERVGTACRRLMRHHPECKEPSDGVHLATALLLNVDEMHTYDKSDLIPLDRKVMRADGVPLRICPPYVVAPPLPLILPPLGAPLPEQQPLPFTISAEAQEQSCVIEWITEDDLERLE